LKTNWSSEEDDILLRAVEKYGEKNWQLIADELESRTGQQCLHRWLKTLKPGIHKGKWNDEEDKQLDIATQSYGVGNWSLICKHVPGRTDVQCRERYMNVLERDIKKRILDKRRR